jgi:hypothetical protein
MQNIFFFYECTCNFALKPHIIEDASILLGKIQVEPQNVL